MNFNEEKRRELDSKIRQIKRKYDRFSTADLVEIKGFLMRVKQELMFNIPTKDLMEYYKDNAWKFCFNHQKSKDCNKQVFLRYNNKTKDGSSFSYIKLH
jgi:hypothetical protein